MIAFLLLTIFVLLSLSSNTKNVGKSDSSAAHAFDFWIGDWRIQQKILRQDGNWLELDAKTSVSPALDGLALVEHWEGSVQFF